MKPTEAEISAVRQLAKKEGVSEIEFISYLQGAAAMNGDSPTLDKLCDIKDVFINEEMEIPGYSYAIT